MPESEIGLLPPLYRLWKAFPPRSGQVVSAFSAVKGFDFTDYLEGLLSKSF
jgi:hypothetical protein